MSSWSCCSGTKSSFLPCRPVPHEDARQTPVSNRGLQFRWAIKPIVLGAWGEANHQVWDLQRMNCSTGPGFGVLLQQMGNQGLSSTIVDSRPLKRFSMACRSDNCRESKATSKALVLLLIPHARQHTIYRLSACWWCRLA